MLFEIASDCPLVVKHEEAVALRIEKAVCNLGNIVVLDVKQRHQPIEMQHTGLLTPLDNDMIHLTTTKNTWANQRYVENADLNFGNEENGLYFSGEIKVGSEVPESQSFGKHGASRWIEDIEKITSENRDFFCFIVEEAFYRKACAENFLRFAHKRGARHTESTAIMHLLPNIDAISTDSENPTLFESEYSGTPVRGIFAKLIPDGLRLHQYYNQESLEPLNFHHIIVGIIGTPPN